MSFLVELPKEVYPANALNGFEVSSDFKLENAQAMMWLSQLAYETADSGKVDEILELWKLKKLGFGPDTPTPRLVPPKARFIVAASREATFVTFSGTDPLNISDWITDFTLAPMADAFHKGFVGAVDAVRSDVELAIRNGGAGRPLFFTGHSMGGALANIAALRALEADVQATAVYTFGGPRTGGDDFFDRYTPKLGDRTFRLVRGHDIVPSVPPSFPGGFRHVGRILQCPHNSAFKGSPSPSNTSNAPSPVLTALNALLDTKFGLPDIGKLRRMDPRTFDQIEGVPDLVTDHVPASYFHALSITL